MTILILDQFSDLGGAQRCLLDLAPALVGGGWKVCAAAPEGRLLSALEERGVEVYRLDPGYYSHGRKTACDVVRFGMALSGLARRIRKLCAETAADLLYVNGPRLMPPVALAKAGCATVFHSHNRIHSAAVRALVRRSVRETGAFVIAASRFAGAQWDSAHVVYNGVEHAPAIRSSGGVKSRIGMIGRISPQKRQKEFVLACQRLCGGSANLEFALAGSVLFGDRRGERYWRELRELAPPNLTLLGWSEDVYALLAELDLLVIPSEAEGGFPRVAMEAFAAGVPVLARACEAVREVIVEGQNGFLLRTGSAEEIAGRVRDLMDDPIGRARAAAAANSLWKERFTLARYRSEMCELLKGIRQSPAVAGDFAAPSRNDLSPRIPGGIPR